MKEWLWFRPSMNTQSLLSDEEVRNEVAMLHTGGLVAIETPKLIVSTIGTVYIHEDLLEGGELPGSSK